MKYLATIAYKGTAYQGFQRQPHQKTIQGVLEKEISRVLGIKTLIKGAGRTDAGVHALDQKISFETKKKIDVERFRFSLNRLLPEDIFVQDVKEVPPTFDARHSVIGKEYVYSLSYGERDPLKEGLVTQIERRDFDPFTFKEAIMKFEGTFDFSNFTTKKEDKDGFIRTIQKIDCRINEEKKTIDVLFVGTHFMTYQVRLMVGAAIKAGLKKIKPDDIMVLLFKRPRHIVSFKAPASGLYLKKVKYEEDF